MRVFQLFRSADFFMKRLAAIDDAMEELRRLVRNQDLDVSDALEKIQRLSARLAKRAERLETNSPSPGDGTPADSGGDRQRHIDRQIRMKRAGIPLMPGD